MAIQDKFNKANVIYKITKDIDLGGETLTIPEGCTLDFQGGSFSNGALVGSNTAIQAGLTKIFGLDIEFSGTWNVAEVYPEWFNDNSEDNSFVIQKCLDSFHCLNLVNNKQYTISKTIIIPTDASIYGNNSKIYISTDFDGNSIFSIGTSETTSNANPYIGDFVLISPVDTTKTQLYIFEMEGIYGRSFTNIRYFGAKGIAYIRSNVWSIVFDKCIFHSYHNNDGTNNYIGVYSSVNDVNKGERICFNNCNFSGFKNIFVISHISSLFINNCSLDYFDNIVQVNNNDGANVSITNCHIESNLNGLNWFYSIGANNQTLSLTNNFIVISTVNEDAYLIDWLGYVYLNSNRITGSSKSLLGSYCSPNCNIQTYGILDNVTLNTKSLNNNILGNGSPSTDKITDFAIESYHSEKETGTVTIDNIDDELVYSFFNIQNGYGGVSILLPTGVKYFIVEFEVKMTNLDSGKLGVILFSSKRGSSNTNFSRTYVTNSTEWTTFRKILYTNEFSYAENKLFIENEGPNTHRYYIKNIKIYPLNSTPSTENVNPSIRKFGTSAYRPTDGLRNGYQYFDTTLNKPIYWTGSSWIDATGTEV